MMKSFALIGFALAAMTGCSVMVRDAKMFDDDVSKVLATKNGDVKACYDTALQTNKTLAGKVTVHFTIEQKTGAFKDIKTDGDAGLGTCVSNALNGLVLVAWSASFTYLIMERLWGRNGPGDRR